MKNAFILVVLALSAQCTTQRQMYVASRGLGSAQAILEKDISHCIQQPCYNSKMKAGDLFMKTSFPGFSISEQSLAFNDMPVGQLLASNSNLRKAYDFSKIVDMTIGLGKGNAVKESSLSELYTALAVYKKSANNDREQKASGAVYSAIDKITCPDYNAGFFPAFLNPSNMSQNASWVVVDKSVSEIDTVLVEGRSKTFLVPAYHLRMEICLLKVVRPWFNLKYVRSGLGSEASAYIEDLIVVRNVSLEDFSQAKVLVTLRNKKVKESTSYPVNKVEIVTPVIIGYIYRII